MLDINYDKSIHRDGIYDVDESCKIKTTEVANNDSFVFVILAIFVLLRQIKRNGIFYAVSKQSLLINSYINTINTNVIT